MGKFHLPDDYIEHPDVIYYDDSVNHFTDVVHQPDVYAAAQHFLKFPDRKTIIDFGCGSGRKLMSLEAERKIGVDFGGNISWCRSQYGNAGEWHEVDFSRPDCRDAARLADAETVVVCSDVVEHVADPQPLLALLAECYRRGAIVITSTPDRVRVRGEQHKGPPPNRSHVREWALAEYIGLLAEHRLPSTYAGYTINNTVSRELKTIITIHDQSIDRGRSEPALPQPPLAILAAYNEADVIAEVVEDLIGQGVDVHVIDNWSNDGTWEAVETLAAKHPSRLVLERFPSDGPSPHYEWGNILHRKEDIAAGFPGRWILHTDGDEIRRSPFAGTSLAEGLAIAQRCGANRVHFNIVNFRPVDDEPYPSTPLEKHFAFFEYGTRPGHFLQGKAWLQGPHKVDLASTGGHMAEFPGIRDFPYKFLLRHYPIRSLEHGRKKIFQDRNPRWSPDERDRLGWHTQYDGFSQDAVFTWDRNALLGFNDLFWVEHGLMILTDIQRWRAME